MQLGCSNINQIQLILKQLFIHSSMWIEMGGNNQNHTHYLVILVSGSHSHLATFLMRCLCQQSVVSKHLFGYTLRQEVAS